MGLWTTALETFWASEERGVQSCLAGIALRELDFADVCEWLGPPCVVPVVIKSLLFPAATD